MRFQIRSSQRYEGAPASQNVTWSAMRESFSARKRRTDSISARVAAASGGAGARKSLPEEIAQVFQVPAFGSIWLLTCPKAGSQAARIRPAVTAAQGWLQTFGKIDFILFLLWTVFGHLLQRHLAGETAMRSAGSRILRHLPH